MKTEYTIKCPVCGALSDESALPLSCSCGKPGLLRAVYGKKRLEPGDVSQGIYRFADWLPLSRTLEGSAAPVTYKSEGLAEILGLKNLYITFNGYWPEKGAGMTTGTFKECEAYSVCGRIPGGYPKTLVVASAGNTARSFAHVCSENDMPLVVVIPEDSLDALWFLKPLSECVKIVAAARGSDYYDAIQIADAICVIDGYMPEGGAKNVARRDGMATTVLSAAVESGRIPDYYFQAVGSGTGAIAAWEAAIRLEEDGGYGKTSMKLMVSQNEPFTLIRDSWRLGSRELAPLTEDLARRQIKKIKATVLSNRKPPYGIAGGLFDALTDSGGAVLSADNRSMEKARELFLKSEGTDITPEAGIALASLMQALKSASAGGTGKKDAADASGGIPRDARIMLNITGGGMKRLCKDKKIYYKKADLVVKKEEAHPDILKRKLAALW